MPRIVDDPNRAVCPDFGGPTWEYLRQSVVNAHQGDLPMTLEQAGQQMKDTWAQENQRQIAAWNDQVREDQEAQDELDRVAGEEAEAQRAQQEKDEGDRRREAEKKKPKLNPYDPERRVEKHIQTRPASYALNKIYNLEYVELDYFTPRGRREAAADANRSISNDTLAFTQTGDTFAIQPMAAIRPSKHIRNDEDISWEDMLDAKNIMLHFMAMSGQWEDAHATSIASFFYNLETHQRKDQKNGKKTLLLYQSRVRREWFDALKRGEGFNIELIEDDLLRDYAEEISESIRDSENAARDREVEQVRLYSPFSPGSKLTSSPLFPDPLETTTLCHPRLAYSPRVTVLHTIYYPSLLPAICHHALAVRAYPHCHLLFLCHVPIAASLCAICQLPSRNMMPDILPHAIAVSPHAICRLTSCHLLSRLRHLPSNLPPCSMHW